LIFEGFILSQSYASCARDTIFAQFKIQINVIG